MFLKKRLGWLTGSHYKMERFGVLFLVLFCCMTVLMVSILQHKRALDAVTLSDQVMYTTNVSTSLSGNSAEVTGIYLNSDRTECFIMLHWSNPSMVVSDASQYHIFLNGADIYGNYQTLQSSPLGQVYIFGQTGYMGIYLTDAAGFPAQVIRIIGRCNSTLTLMDSIPTYADSSFNQYDQFELYFNPGAAGAEPAAFLEEGRLGLFDIYQSVVLQGEEDVIKTQMETDLVQMQSLLAQIEENIRNLENTNLDGAHIIVPDAPVEIRGDRIVENADGQLELDAVTLFDGGFDFDWRNLSLQGSLTGDGYLDAAMGDDTAGMTPSHWLSVQKARGDVSMSKGLELSNVDWYWSNGELWTGDNPAELDRLNRISTMISNIRSAWSQYYVLKQDYQITQPYLLLQMEVNASDVVQSYSVNSDNVVTCW